jgi:hypothetical protein
MKHLFKLQDISLLLLFSLFLIITLEGEVFAANEATSAPAKKNQRNYPHGQDEEDLKVQVELKKPEAFIDEKSIQARVLKNFLKKTGEDTPVDSESGYKSQ